MADQTDEDIAVSPGDRLQVFRWLTVSVLGLVVFVVIAAHAPARIRLLGLFTLGFGLLAGAGLGWLSGEFHLKPNRKLACLMFVFVFLGISGMFWESHRSYVERLRKIYDQPHLDRPNPEKPVSMGKAAILAQATEALREARRKKFAVESLFSTYLVRRTQFGKRPAWTDPWPVVLALGELIIGSICGAWMFLRVSRTRQRK
jgi:hypothetical protein